MGSLQLPCTSIKENLLVKLGNLENHDFLPRLSNHWDGISEPIYPCETVWYFQHLPTTVLQVTLLELDGTTKHTEHIHRIPQSAGAFMIRVIRMIRKALKPLVPSILGAAGPCWAMLGPYGHMVSVKILKGQVLEIPWAQANSGMSKCRLFPSVQAFLHLKLNC